MAFPGRLQEFASVVGLPAGVCIRILESELVFMGRVYCERNHSISLRVVSERVYLGVEVSRQLVRAVPLREGLIFVLLEGTFFLEEHFPRLQLIVELLHFVAHILGRGETGPLEGAEDCFLAYAFFPVLDAGVLGGGVEVFAVHVHVDVFLNEVVNVLLLLGQFCGSLFCQRVHRSPFAVRNQSVPESRGVFSSLGEMISGPGFWDHYKDYKFN